jgi:hypothetical protein
LIWKDFALFFYSKHVTIFVHNLKKCLNISTPTNMIAIPLKNFFFCTPLVRREEKFKGII